MASGSKRECLKKLGAETRGWRGEKGWRSVWSPGDEGIEEGEAAAGGL